MSKTSNYESERDKKKKQEAIIAADTAISTIKKIKQKAKKRKG